MKRTLPAIVILTTLSLLGLILMQASWLKNLLEVRQSQILNKAFDATKIIASDLSKAAYGATIRIPRKTNRVTGDWTLKLLKPQTIDEKFTKKEIFTKLRKQFDSQELKNMDFEFAVVTNEGEYEMYTENFVRDYNDSTNKKIHAYIVSENESNLEVITQAEQLIVIVPNFKKQVWDNLKWIITGAAIFMLIIIAAFYVTLRSLFNQKKLSEIKSDFINNMTHEFKTPLATISLAIDAIRNEKVQGDKEKVQYFSSIIKEENKRMNKHVETILQAALMEKQEFQLNLVPINVNETLQYVLDSYELQLLEKNAKIETNFLAKHDKINADETHFTNLLSNLIDNAIKYAKENLVIKVSTQSNAKAISIKIEDNGIGMNKETINRIFEKFYRAHTGNIHNVKGFGLGLSYVKTMVDAHHGTIKAESVLGKGSCFIITMPLPK